MNKQIQTLKKSLAKIYKRTKNSNKQQLNGNKAFWSYTPSTSGASSSATDYCHYGTSNQKQSSSSGYMSPNDLDNHNNANPYLYYPDALSEDVCAINDQTVRIIRNKQIEHLLKYQADFVNKLNFGLDNFVRPMSIILNAKLYSKLFQNIEKIVAITEFLRNQITESFKFTADIYTSTLTVLNEYIKVIQSAYDTYTTGYQQARYCARNPKVKKFIQSLNLRYKTNFELNKFLALPISNIKCIVRVLNVLIATQDLANENEHVLLNVHENFKQIKTSARTSTESLMKPESTSSDATSAVWSLTSTTTSTTHEPYLTDYDYVDTNGNKYYFV